MSRPSFVPRPAAVRRFWPAVLIPPLLAVAPLPVGAAFPQFRAPFLAYDCGGTPSSVAVADVNQDGRADMAVTSQYSSTAMVMLRNADGTFQPGVDWSVNFGPRAVLLTDVNGDGRPDLLTTGTMSGGLGSVAVRLGTGGGAFGPRTDYTAGITPIGFAVADLNADGFSDLAVADEGPNIVAVLLGNGDGTFDPRTEYPAGDDPRAVAVGDLNADGRLDLVVASFYSYGLLVLLGNGDGSFGAATVISLGGFPNQPTSVVVADLDADGDADLAAGMRNNLVAVLLGNGDATFGPKSGYPIYGPASDLVAGDFDRNGSPDLAASGIFLSVLRNNGNGTFAPRLDFVTPDQPVALAAGNLGGDGVLDVALLSSGTNTVAVLRGNGDGTFGTPVDVATGAQPGSVAIGDLNGDTHPDVVTANRATGANSVSVLRGNGDGTFAAKTDFTVGSTPWRVALGDLDHDGHLDLVTANYGSFNVSVRLGLGDGTFAPRVDLPASQRPTAVMIGDLNADGHPDLVIALASGSVTIRLGAGNGSFGPETFLAGGPLDPASLALGDVNLDGHVDVVVAGYSTLLYLGNGDGTFGFPTVIPGSVWVAMTDLNADGRLDLATAGLNGLMVVLGNGDGTFGAESNYPVIEPGGLAATDFDGDGHTDLAAACSRNLVTLFRGNGDGTFGPPAPRPHHGTGNAPWAIAAGDLNHDGRPDAVTANVGANTISVLLNPGGALAAEPPAVPARVRLASPAPHPVRDRATFSFALPRRGEARLHIYDIAGRRVATLDAGDRPAGAHRLGWDRRVRGGGRAPAGVYVVELIACGERVARRMVLLQP